MSLVRKTSLAVLALFAPAVVAGCAADADDTATDSDDVTAGTGLTGREISLTREFLDIKAQYSVTPEMTDERRYGGARVTRSESGLFIYDFGLTISALITTDPGARAVGDAVDTFVNVGSSSGNTTTMEEAEKKLRAAVVEYPKDARRKAKFEAASDLAGLARNALSSIPLPESSTSEDRAHLDVVVRCLQILEDVFRLDKPAKLWPAQAIGTDVARVLERARAVEDDGCNHPFFREPDENQRCLDTAVGRILHPARNAAFNPIIERFKTK